MAKYIDQTITVTFEELKVLRDAIILYEEEHNTDVDALWDKLEHGFHDSLGERIRAVKAVCNDCDFKGTTMCPLIASNGTNCDCDLREDMIEGYREEEKWENEC